MSTVHDLSVSREPVGGLHTFAGNPRRGDLPLLMESLTVNGQYRPLVVNRGTYTGRASEVLAGNHTLMAARELGWSDVAVSWVDVDDDHARRIVAADNRLADLGGYDEAELAELLGALDGLEGTGYADSDLEELLAGLVDDDDEDEDDGDAGEAVELWGAVVGDPDLLPKEGSVWTLCRHHLCVVPLASGHGVYGPLLEPDSLLFPYPSLLAPWLDRVQDRHVVMVQPHPYLAGWLLTKWNRLTPDDPAVEVSAPGEAS